MSSPGLLASLQKCDPMPLCSHGKGYLQVSKEHTACPQLPIYRSLPPPPSPPPRGTRGCLSRGERRVKALTSTRPTWLQVEGVWPRLWGFHTNYSLDYEHKTLPQWLTGRGGKDVYWMWLAWSLCICFCLPSVSLANSSSDPLNSHSSLKYSPLSPYFSCLEKQ